MSDDDRGAYERRRRGLETMRRVYGWEFEDGPGDFFAYTADHLFADIWNRPGLSIEQRRLLLVGLLAGRGDDGVLEIQLGAAYRNGELDDEGLREIAVFLAHYAGWPTGASINMIVERILGGSG